LLRFVATVKFGCNKKFQVNAMSRLTNLQQTLLATFGQEAELLLAYDELTLTVPMDQWVSACETLRDTPSLCFEQCLDLCGVDYSTYAVGKEGQPEANRPDFPARYAVVIHLMSIKHNWRLRVRVWVTDNEFPVLPSLTNVWPSANWYEREAFDLFGVVFEGHPDLRRILTDYGFIGHPFRKDFPVYGNVEMRYDPEQGRVVYQPVTIDPREVIPRVVREDGYGVGR
jgi:NADH-quinone oxidoreductase subunit C